MIVKVTLILMLSLLLRSQDANDNNIIPINIGDRGGDPNAACFPACKEDERCDFILLSCFKSPPRVRICENCQPPYECRDGECVIPIAIGNRGGDPNTACFPACQAGEKCDAILLSCYRPLASPRPITPPKP